MHFILVASCVLTTVNVGCHYISNVLADSARALINQVKPRPGVLRLMDEAKAAVR